MTGLKLKNSTTLYLMLGPITIFDGGVYAGNARFLDMPPVGERLITYALDLETEIPPETTELPPQLVSVKLV